MLIMILIPYHEMPVNVHRIIHFSPRFSFASWYSLVIASVSSCLISSTASEINCKYNSFILISSKGQLMLGCSHDTVLIHRSSSNHHHKLSSSPPPSQ